MLHQALLWCAVLVVTASLVLGRVDTPADFAPGVLSGVQPKYLLPVLMYGPGNQLAGFKEVAVGTAASSVVARAC